MILQIYVPVYTVIFMLAYIDGSCKTSSGIPICCEGKQSHCYGYTYTNDTSIEQVRIQSRFKYGTHPIKAVKLKKCFCDNSCTLTGDCCPDYRDICHKPITDCAVSDWDEWNMCSEKCTKGIQTRKRKILIPPKNGGKPCPVLVETKECQLWNCRNQRIGRSHRNQLMRLAPSKEVAYLMPARNDVMQVLRRHDIRWDVRRKLYYGRLIQMNVTEQPDPDPYCVSYQITYASEGCRQIYSAHAFNKNNGEEKNNFYDSQMRVLPAAWVSHEFLLRPGHKVCVTCYPAYMRKDLGNRCLGTGIEMIETRWRGVGTPDCHGRFKMVRAPRQNCTCNSLASFLFV